MVALRTFDQLLAAAIARLHAVQGADPFRGLHIGAEEVERWLKDGQTEAGETSIAAGLTSIMARAVSTALEDPAFRWIADTYALSPFQAGVLLIALAPEVDLH